MTQSATRQFEPPKIPKWMLGVQVFLLRRNIIRPLNKALMVITTTGRKTGKKHSLPIGYVRDGDKVLTFNSIRGGRRSNWYENVLANKTATLEIQGKKMDARGEPIDIDNINDFRHVITVYKNHAPDMFERFFGVAPDAPIEQQTEIVKQNARFMRFTPTN